MLGVWPDAPPISQPRPCLISDSGWVDRTAVVDPSRQ